MKIRITNMRGILLREVDAMPLQNWLDFAVHRSPDDPDKWRVSHIETGFALPIPDNASEYAVAMAAETFLSSKGATRVAEVIERTKERAQLKKAITK